VKSWYQESRLTRYADATLVFDRVISKCPGVDIILPINLPQCGDAIGASKSDQV
jgi:hypothetical protein